MRAIRYSVIVFGSVALSIQLIMMSKYGVATWWGLAFLCTVVGFIKALREVINGE